MGHFFVSCPLGFESELTREIKEFWFEMIDLDGLPTRAEFPEMEALQGGLEFETADHIGFQINLFSKIANRVLLRIAKFEARYFDQFEKGLSQVDLSKWLDFELLKGRLQVKIEHHKSRLNNEKNLLEATQNVLAKKNIKIDSEAAQTLYIRIDKDRVTLSLDTSGEHLHRRGYAQHRGEAPLRETLAAYLIRKLAKHADMKSLLTIVDPFAGSGTILFEALSQHRPLFDRAYAWLQFKSTAKLFKSPTWTKNFRWLQNRPQLSAYGFDIDAKSVVNFSENKLKFEKMFQLENLKLSSLEQNSAKLDLSALPVNGPKWIVTNPPYGIRLNDNQALETLTKLEKQVDGLIVIHPESWNFKFQNLKQVEQESFSNQGLKLLLTVFKRPI